jgi:hypothetical protein
VIAREGSAETPGPVAQALTEYLAEFTEELDGRRPVLAATAMSLAGAIDDASRLGSAAALAAIPRLAAQLGEVLAVLGLAEEGADARLRRMLAPVTNGQ